MEMIYTTSDDLSNRPAEWRVFRVLPGDIPRFPRNKNSIFPFSPLLPTKQVFWTFRVFPHAAMYTRWSEAKTHTKQKGDVVVHRPENRQGSISRRHFSNIGREHLHSRTPASINVASNAIPKHPIPRAVHRGATVEKQQHESPCLRLTRCKPNPTWLKSLNSSVAARLTES